ncbi:MAG: TetR/AcrR family transcriptional regulator [Lawsonella clevelandensis]
MPRIAAKTVKEHRENIETALVDAAEEILRNEPGTELTAAAIAKRAGIARNSIYRYVTSVNDLRRLVIERYMPGWMAAVAAATADIDDPREWLSAWLTVNLEQAAASDHGWMRTIVVNAENPGGRTPNVTATIDNRNSFTRAGVDVDEVHARANSNLADVWRNWHQAEVPSTPTSPWRNWEWGSAHSRRATHLRRYAPSSCSRYSP